MYGVVLLFVKIATAAAFVCLFVCYLVCVDWFVHFCLGGLLWLADPLGATRHGGQRRRPR
jgi:hypothetical protein